MRCLLSIDSGGTKCQTVVVKEDGVLLGWGCCGFADKLDRKSAYHGSGRSVESVNGAIAQALRGVEYTELHVVSYNRPRSLDAVIAKNLRGKVRFHPAHESDGILDLAGLSFGIIASAGTGSFVHVLKKDGNRLHFDSLGPLLGDYGSAYHVGFLAVQAAAKYDWHPRHRTPLKDAIYHALDIEEKAGSGASLIWVFDRVKDRAVIADLARIVDEEARRGDAVANAILSQAASYLAQTVYDAYDGAQLKDCGYTLVGTGGVIEGSDIYWRYLCDHVREFAPDLQFARTELPHVVGTALSALHIIANGDLEAAKDRLIGCAKEVFRSDKRSSLNDPH